MTLKEAVEQRFPEPPAQPTQPRASRASAEPDYVRRDRELTRQADRAVAQSFREDEREALRAEKAAAKAAANPFALTPEMKMLRTTNQNLGVVERMRQKQIEDFDRGPGRFILEAPLKGVDTFGEFMELDALEQQAAETVGTIRGALTPGVAAGDPSEGAVKARQRMAELVQKAREVKPDIRNVGDLRQYRDGLQQERLRLVAQAEGVKKRRAEIAMQYGSQMASFYGFDASTPEGMASAPEAIQRAVEAGDSEGAQAIAEQVAQSYSTLPPETQQQVDKTDTSFWGAVRQAIATPISGMAETAQVAGALMGSDIVSAAGRKAQGAAEAIAPDNYKSAGSEFADTFNPTLLPRAIIEQLGQIGGSLLARGVGAAIGSAAGPKGTVVGGVAGPALFAAAQIVGPVARERAKNDGREEVTKEDLAYALGTAGVSGALDSYATRFLPGGDKVAAAFKQRLRNAILGEGLTETAQSVTEQVGGTVATERGLDVSPKQALAEGVIGAGAGGVATTAAEPLVRRGQQPAAPGAQTAQQPATPAQDTPPPSAEESDTDFTPEVDDELAAEMGTNESQGRMMEGQVAQTEPAPAIPAPPISAPVAPAPEPTAPDNSQPEQPTPSGAEPISQEPPVGDVAAPQITSEEQKPTPTGSTPVPADTMREPRQAEEVETQGVVGATSEADEAPAPVSTVPAPSAEKAGAEAKGMSGESPADRSSFALPRDLAGAKPSYAYGSKQFTLKFASDLDKALYIVAQKTPSKRDADYLKAIAAATGMTEAEARRVGATVRNAIKVRAKDAEAGELAIPPLAPTRRAPDPLPSAAAPAATEADQAGSAPARPTSQPAAETPSQPPASESDQPQAPTTAPTPEPAQGAGQFAGLTGIDLVNAAIASAGPVPSLPGTPESRELRKKAEAYANQAKRVMEGIEPGQPILSTRDRNKRDRSIELQRKASDALREAERLEADTSTPSPRPADVSKNEAKTDASGERASNPPVFDTRQPAPIVARGANKPAEFVRAIGAAVGMTGSDRPLRAVADLAVRLHRAAPANFEAMEVNALSEAEWKANPATGSMTPDSAAAYNPETNTLFLRTERLKDSTALVSALVHESGHFAERFALPEALIAREWAKLDDAQIEQAAADYNPSDARTAAAIRQDPRARSEWVAQQFARVVAGKAKTVPDGIRARLEAFFAAMKEFATKWLGTEFASSPAFDAEVLRVMGFDADAMPVGPTPSATQGQELTVEAAGQDIQRLSARLGTQYEKARFSAGYADALKSPGKQLDPQPAGIPAKDQKFQDAYRNGWAAGQMALRTHEKVVTAIKEGREYPVVDGERVGIKPAAGSRIVAGKVFPPLAAPTPSAPPASLPATAGVTSPGAGAETALPKENEVFATEQMGGMTYEYAVVRGLLKERPEMYGIGMRLKGSNDAFESAGVGHRMDIEGAVERFADRQFVNESLSITNPYVAAKFKQMQDAEATKKAKARAEEDESKAKVVAAVEQSRAFQAAIDAVKLPTGKKIAFDAKNINGETYAQRQGTQYAGWAVAKNSSSSQSPYDVFHVASGLRAQGAKTFKEAMDIVRGFFLAGIDGSAPQVNKNKDVLKRLASVVTFIKAGTVPDWFTPSSVTAQPTFTKLSKVKPEPAKPRQKPGPFAQAVLDGREEEFIAAEEADAEARRNAPLDQDAIGGANNPLVPGEDASSAVTGGPAGELPLGETESRPPALTRAQSDVEKADAEIAAIDAEIEEAGYSKALNDGLFDKRNAAENRRDKLLSKLKREETAALARARANRELLGTPASRVPQTETPEFKRWFGDSKVVDSQGKPLVVYHGTYNPEFTAFKPNSYFAPDPEIASEYIQTTDRGGMYPAYIKLENPLYVRSLTELVGEIPSIESEVEFGAPLFEALELKAVRAAIKEAGYDGVRFRDMSQADNRPHDAWLVFDPTNIKSAIGNSGAFDPANPSILGTPADTAPEERAGEGQEFSRFQDSLRARGVPVERAPYAVRPQNEVAAEARAIIANQGEVIARGLATDRNSGIRGDVRLGIIGELMGREMEAFRAAKPEDQPAMMARMNALAMASRDLNSTEAGQTIAMHAHIYRDQRIAAPMEHIKAVSDRQEGAIGPDGKAALDDAEGELNKPVREVSNEIAKRAKEKAKGVKVSKGIWEQYRADAAERMVRFVDDASSAPKAQAPLAEFTGRVVAEMKARLAEFMPDKSASERANLTPLEIITEAVENKAKAREVFESVREEFVAQFGEGSAPVELIDAELANMGIKPYSTKTRDRAVKGAFKAMQANVADLAKQHVTRTNKTAADLAAALVAETGLKQADADALAADLDAAARKMIAEAREKALAKLKAKAEADTPRAKKIVTAIGKLTTLNNLGALTRADLMKAVAKELNLPEVRAEDMRRIAELADKVETAPNGLARSRAQRDLMVAVRVAQGISAADVGLSVWLSNLLSGPMTQVGNLVGNSMHTSAQIMALAMTNPSRARFAFSGWVDGLGAGFTHARDILKTGTSLREMGELNESTKTGDIGNVLEAVNYERDFKRLPKNLARGLQIHANAMRYVSRAMRAADAVFFYPAKEAYAQVMTAKLLEGEYKGKELVQKVRESLGMAPDQFIRFTRQAEAEGFTDSLDKAIRVHQLIEEARANSGAVQKTDAASNEFGKETTYNQEPVGTAGIVYRIAREGVNKLPALRLILPFLRTPTNVFNASLNFTPLGAKRAFFGTKDTDGKTTKQFTAEERARLYFQSVAGTIGMATIAAAALAEADDEDPFFTITAKGTGDWKKNEQLQQAGWRPFSIKVGNNYYNYRDTPFLLPLAAIGHIVDAKRYQKTKDTLAGRNPYLDALFRMPPTIFETSMLSGLGIIADVATGDFSPAKMEAFVANSATSAIIPNAVKQVDRFVSQERRDIDGIGGRVGASVPILRQTGSIETDMLGEAVTTSPGDRLFSTGTDDELRQVLRDKKVFISVPDKDTRLDGRTMTEEEFKAYYRFYGEEMGRRLRPMTATLRRMPPGEQIGKLVDRVEADAREAAKAKVRQTVRRVPVLPDL